MTPEEARDLTAYAADIARRIAPEYRAEYQADGYATRIVRRYVTEPEEA